MPRPLTTALCLAWAFACAALNPPPRADAAEYAFFHENVMGTSLELRVTADRADEAHAAEARALREIDRLSAVFSGYDPRSEFSRWSKTSGEAVRVSAELFEVLKSSDRWRERSGGAFDPRVEVLTRLWSAGAAQGREPSALEQDAANSLRSRPAWKLDASQRTATRTSSCPLTLNAIAKGFIVGKASEAAMGVTGVRGVLLNVGGDMRACGEGERMVGVAPPEGDSETTEPFTYLAVRDRAVATSGNSQRGFRVGRPLAFAHF